MNAIYDSAEAALEQIMKAEPPMSDSQILIFDIRLPGMSGLELAAELRERGEQRPILIVSAYQPPPRAQLKDLDAHFMPKPFDFAGIVAKIQELAG